VADPGIWNRGGGLPLPLSPALPFWPSLSQNFRSRVWGAALGEIEFGAF